MTPVKAHMHPKNDNNKTTTNLYTKMKSTFTSFLSVIANNKDSKQNHNIDASVSTTTVTIGWRHYEISQSNTSYVRESRQRNGWDTSFICSRPLTWADNIIEIPELESDDED